jgi:hypothetical protein
VSEFADPSLVPLEKALLTRAKLLGSGEGAFRIAAAAWQRIRIHGGARADADTLGSVLADVLAAEFRALVGELRNQ